MGSTNASGMTRKVVKGSCLCRAIEFEMYGDPANNCLCFCNSCRKITGAVGMANSWCDKENFKLVSGDSTLRFYEDRSCDSGGTIHRGFCSECGSTMMSENRVRFPGQYIVPVGALDIDPAQNVWAPSMEFFVKRKAPWFSTPENTTKFVELF